MNDFDEGIQLATKLKCGINRNDKINCILQSQKNPLFTMSITSKVID